MSTTGMTADQTIEATHGPGLVRTRGITLVRGEGVRVYDDQDNPYIDCTAGYGVAGLGHAHPIWARAVAEQASRLTSVHLVLSNDQRSAYMQELAAALPGDLSRVFLCNSGTEAIEAAIKFARLQTGRTGVVACMRGFHGRTMGALSATWDKKSRETFAPLLEGFRHVPYGGTEALSGALTDDVGCLILEVVQGEGGVRPATAEFLRTAQQLCRERGVLLVVDEVQTGFGRTGRLFAIEHHGLEPDMVCLAKGIAGGFPMGAVAFGGRVDPLPVGAHGSTFGGNPLACAAARATLGIIRDEGLVENARVIGQRLLDGIRAIESPRIREVRGLGLLIGIELKERVGPLVRALQDRGVLVLNAGPTVVRLLPPLVIDEEAADTVVAALREVLP